MPRPDGSILVVLTDGQGIKNYPFTAIEWWKPLAHGLMIKEKACNGRRTVYPWSSIRMYEIHPNSAEYAKQLGGVEDTDVLCRHCFASKKVGHA